MKKILIAMIGASLLMAGGCLQRTYYFAPTKETMSKGEDGLARGAVQSEGFFSWFSEAPGKNFANPSFSIIGK